MKGGGEGKLLTLERDHVEEKNKRQDNGSIGKGNKEREMRDEGDNVKVCRTRKEKENSLKSVKKEEEKEEDGKEWDLK